jgi:hypothetical protein
MNLKLTGFSETRLYEMVKDYTDNYNSLYRVGIYLPIECNLKLENGVLNYKFTEWTSSVKYPNDTIYPAPELKEYKGRFNLGEYGENYRNGIDNSGGKYIIAQFHGSKLFNHAIWVNDKRDFERISIQTWDYQEVHLQIRYYNKKRDGLEVETLIYKLDVPSSYQLKEFFQEHNLELDKRIE